MGKVAKHVMMKPSGESINLVYNAHMIFVECIFFCDYKLINLVLMSPETATSTPWRNVFGEQYYRSNLCSIAVDESHCIVEWLVKLM